MSTFRKNSIRIVTAASLFDGHDVSINLMRRLLQEAGAEVIHLGHNRSAFEVVSTVLQEGAQGLCLSSYQGGHMEYFKYIKDLLRGEGADFVKIFGGGGGVIIQSEKKELEDYGIDFIFHPEDSRHMGLEGMIQMIMDQCDFSLTELLGSKKFTPPPGSSQGGVRRKQDMGGQFASDKIQENLGYTALFQKPIPQSHLGWGLSFVEEGRQGEIPDFVEKSLGAFSAKNSPLVLGVTGTGGAGKSSLVDELIQRFSYHFPDMKWAVVCVDPSKKKTGGALLGDRIRMNSLTHSKAFMRSVATRGSSGEIADSLPRILAFLKKCDFDLIIAETSGVGQSSGAILDISDLSLYVMTSEFGAQSQLEKIDMLDYADLIAINKKDRRGSLDALRDVRKQYSQSHKLFNSDYESFPIFLTQAAQFNDEGVYNLFFRLTDLLSQSDVSRRWALEREAHFPLSSEKKSVGIPIARQNHLSEVVEEVRKYKSDTRKWARKAQKLGSFYDLRSDLAGRGMSSDELIQMEEKLRMSIPSEHLDSLEQWDKQVDTFYQNQLVYRVRGREIREPLTHSSLSGTSIRRVVPPQVSGWGDRLTFLRLENFPGQFPYTAGVFPLKRSQEDPIRMFAGEGTPERTNQRFHHLSKEAPAHRLSTAFDSVTLYGQDPERRPDIFGKIGEGGVSICTLEDMKKLYQGFDLCDPTTSVSMTINGPAPIILAFFFNTVKDQQVEKKEKELGRPLTTQERLDVEAKSLQSVRGTVQADILKEDQGQNTCIFSIDFALQMMGDVQEYFIKNGIRNFYSVSISGYHIAEAGANPISQVAFTLSNAFTLVESYLARGMEVDDFAPNLSFFFSNGMDPEYCVIGRVARRIWSIAMKNLYKANSRSQQLKYHIQTSGRSLHAQEMAFNDIRTTLQALLALTDNCNSLHTNAYDEAITTPTRESVRRAMAIQMIINKEFGLCKNENPSQGSYFINELTDLVEEAILDEFTKINARGGVLAAMESQYQRSQIQKESMHYEYLKHSGELPLIGVNYFIDSENLEDWGGLSKEESLARASQEEKTQQLENLLYFQQKNKSQAQRALENLKKSVLKGENTFVSLMEASRHCSLGQMTEVLFQVGGQYRRNL